MNQRHRSLVQCPNCAEKGILSNISGLHSMTVNGTKKLDKVGLCKTCNSIFKVKLVELKEVDEHG